MQTFQTSRFFLQLRALKDWRWRRRIYAHADAHSGIDQDARELLADLVIALATGKITNDQYEDNVPVRSEDPAIAAIDRFAWSLYPDMKRCQLEDDLAPDAEADAVAVACVLFLMSELEYQWPLPDPMPWLTWLVDSLGGRPVKPDCGKPQEDGFWPFASEEEAERESKKHTSDELGEGRLVLADNQDKQPSGECSSPGEQDRPAILADTCEEHSSGVEPSARLVLVLWFASVAIVALVVAAMVWLPI